MGESLHVLAKRLARLVEHGIFEKKAYIDRQQRFGYVLTLKGQNLKPILMAMVEWGVNWTEAEVSTQIMSKLKSDSLL